MIGKTFTFNMVSNSSFDDITGKVSASEFGDDVLHVTTAQTMVTTFNQILPFLPIIIIAFTGLIAMGFRDNR